VCVCVVCVCGWVCVCVCVVCVCVCVISKPQQWGELGPRRLSGHGEGGGDITEDVVLNKKILQLSHCVDTRNYREPLQHTQKTNACFYSYISHIRITNTIRISQQALVNLSLWMLITQLVTVTNRNRRWNNKLHWHVGFSCRYCSTFRLLPC